MKPHLTPTDLQSFMDANGISGELMLLDSPTPTVEAAAEAVGTQPERIVKSVLFTIDGDPVLAITCGTKRIDYRSIAGLHQVGRKRVRLADAETVLAHTGYPVGTVPPFGHPSPIPTLLDPTVLEHPDIYAGGGAHNALIHIQPQVILETTNATLLDLHHPPSKD